jgi:hypothetical protein
MVGDDHVSKCGGFVLVCLSLAFFVMKSMIDEDGGLIEVNYSGRL